MPWVPTTDFEEEIVNLQPDHDFIYGALSEPEPQRGYPRPKAHLDYAVNLKMQAKKQQDEYEATGRINEKLHVIAQVQRMAGTKPLGEQPTIDDWDSVKDVEKETVAMMRYCGFGPSVEEPLNQKVTIATYPVKNNVEVVKNGRKKVPLFFDENMFKLKPKISNSSSGFDSANSSGSKLNDSMVNKDDSLQSISQGNNSSDTSFNTSSSLNTSNSFYTGENDTPEDSNALLTAYKRSQLERQTLLLREERMRQYDKLHEETASLSISNHTKEYDSFKTADENNSWMPCAEYDDSFNKNGINWPSLKLNKTDSTASKKRKSKKSSSKNNTMESSSSSQDHCTNNYSSSDRSSNCSLCETQFTNFLQRFVIPDSKNTSETSSEISIASSSTSNFLQRFVIPDSKNTCETSSEISIASSLTSSVPIMPLTYANMAKPSSTLVAPQPPPPRNQGAISKSSNIIEHVPRFYTAREIYERKRRVQN